MIIALHDGDFDHMKNKTYPNYALMKISAWHKAKGDAVEWWNPLFQYDCIYSSKIFDFTPDDPYLPIDAPTGGTGYDIKRALPEEIDHMRPDYSIYPNCDYAIGFTTRGCPRHCRWCVVPEKEGNIKPYRRWQELVKPDSDQLVLMDNNILACDHGINQLGYLIGSGYNIDLNQGMDARLVDDGIASILSRLDWIRYIRFSCDSVSQIDSILRAACLLFKYGIRPYRLFVYMLITPDLYDASQRVEALKKLKGIRLYAQAERNERLGIIPNREQLEFAQRYIYGGSYRRETWEEYKNRSLDYASRCRNCGKKIILNQEGGAYDYL